MIAELVPSASYETHAHGHTDTQTHANTHTNETQLLRLAGLGWSELLSK